MDLKKKTKSKKQSKSGNASGVLIPLEVIKTAYIVAKGLITVAADACQISVRQYKNYLYVHYKKEMAEVIEATIEKRADDLMGICDKIFQIIKLKADLSIEIMSVPKEQRKAEDFDLLKTLSIREMQFLVFMLEVYGKHRGFGRVYDAADYDTVTDQKQIMEEEEKQVLNDSLLELKKHKPEIISQLRVVEGGRK